MDRLQLTRFQITAEARVREALESAGLAVAERKAISAQMPHMSAPETAVKLIANGVEVWLYEDEATFSTATEDRRFERPDFADEDTLLDSLVAELKRAISTFHK